MSAPDPKRLADDLHRAADAAEPGSIDLDAVLARSRAARRTRRSALVGGAAALAVAGVFALGAGLVGGLGPFAPPASTTADAPAGSAGPVAEEGASQDADPGAESGVAPEVEPETDDLAVGRLGAAAACGRPVPDASAPAPLGLTAAVTAASVAADGSASADVVVRNSGVEPVSGRLEAVILAFASGGTVLEAGAGAGGVAIDLEPGASATVPVRVGSLDCDAAGLPSAGLEAVATVEVAVGGAGASVLVVSSPGPAEVG